MIGLILMHNLLWNTIPDHDGQAILSEMCCNLV